MTDEDLRAAILERLDYHPHTGVFTHRPGFPGVVAGAILGTPDSNGKLQATFLGKRYPVSHLVWLVETGALPNEALRHINSDGADCRFDNLREWTAEQRREIGLQTPQAKAARKRQALAFEEAKQRHAVRVERAAQRKRERDARARAKDPDKHRRKVAKSARKHHQRHKNDPQYRAGKAARLLLNRTVRAIAQDRTASTEALLGYSVAQFQQHIEAQFEDWMHWGNHGEWHIDHIKPVAAFLFEGVTALHVINALDNLRPLSAAANLAKGSSYSGKGTGRQPGAVCRFDSGRRAAHKKGFAVSYGRTAAAPLYSAAWHPKNP